jgi:hypothetical protein
MKGKMGSKGSNQTVSQAPSKGGGSAPQGTAVGSGSRPTGGKIKLMSSNPSNAQKIRPG